MKKEFEGQERIYAVEIKKIRENPDLLDEAAGWFHEKWKVPLAAYEESMLESLHGGAVPAWYVVTEKGRIVAGLGVIENDFHDRKDLRPNVCAVYVEKEYRCQGIAGKMLNFVCEDMAKKGIRTLYLVTDHTSFYERYGWEFFCMVQGDDESNLTRMYIRRS